MAFLYYLFMFLHVAACFFLIAVVLLQQGKGQDLASAFGGGGSQTAFGPRGPRRCSRARRRSWRGSSW